MTRRKISADPVGIVEIAWRLGTSRGVVDVWRNRGVLPRERWTIGGRPAWDWSDIVAWCHDSGRARLLDHERAVEVAVADLARGAE